MARDGAGNYSLASGNPVTTGTVISSTWANNTLSDIATAVTGSVAADGQTTITGALKGAVGSVGAPGYTFTGDTDTGGWHPAANTLAWSTAGAEAVRIDSSQNVGIGVTPAERLDISSGASATLIRFRNGSASSGYIGYDATSLKFYTTALERLVLTSDGRFYGTALHNNAGAVTGTTTQYLASGTYTPTLTNTTNITSSTAQAAQWMRVGNVVTVSGSFQITPTATGAAVLGISLPIASTLAAASNASGLATDVGNIQNWAGTISGDVANARAKFNIVVTAASASTFYYSYSYVVL
jgi:hypothetical protein